MADANEVTESTESVVLEWTERNEADDFRVGQMYCFKSCNANQN